VPLLEKHFQTPGPHPNIPHYLTTASVKQRRLGPLSELYPQEAADQEFQGGEREVEQDSRQIQLAMQSLRVRAVISSILTLSNDIVVVVLLSV